MSKIQYKSQEVNAQLILDSLEAFVSAISLTEEKCPFRIISIERPEASSDTSITHQT